MQDVQENLRPEGLLSFYGQMCHSHADDLWR